jgi:nucleotide-binding universal stress UspA family protein
MEARSMNKQQPIVVATDFSAPARHAAWRAAMLAAATGAPLTLAHTVTGTALDDLRRWAADGDTSASVVETDADQRLQELAAGIRKRHGVEAQTHLSLGHPVEQIARHANDVAAGLVVTGTRGAGFARGVVIGSTAERIAKRSASPVLMVRQLPHEPYRRILIPVDFSGWSHAPIELARRIAPQATLVLMHAVELPYEGRMRLAGVANDTVRRYRDTARHEAQSRLRQLATDAGLGADQVTLTMPDGADPWMLIVREEQEQDCDLVVIGRQGRHALEELMLGSTTRMVVTEGAADVLISTQRSG